MFHYIERPTKSDFDKIVDLIKKTDTTEHYDCSQWYDYKMYLNALLMENGFKIKY